MGPILAKLFAAAVMVVGFIALLAGISPENRGATIPGAIFFVGGFILEALWEILNVLCAMEKRGRG